MKKLNVLMIILILGQAWPAAAAKKFLNPNSVYSAMTRAFPELVEDLGGFSSEIEMKRLTCGASTMEDHKTGEVSVKTTCYALGREGQRLEAEGTELFLVLLNSGVALDRTSEPASTYILLHGITCTRLEPRSNPNEPAHVQFDCDYDYNLKSVSKSGFLRSR